MAYIKKDDGSVLIGTAADDTLDGLNGLTQWLYGGLGNDTYLVEPYDNVFENAGEGTDTVILNSLEGGSYTLGSNFENLSLLAGDYAGTLTGTDANNIIALGLNDAVYNVFLVNGGAGNDTIIVGSGNNIGTIDGGTGNDTVTVGANAYVNTIIVDSAADIVTLGANAVVGNITSTAAAFVLPTGVWELTLAGSGNINGSGNALDNSIIGNSGNNVLDGGLGNDDIFGDAGNDTLIGNFGDDWLHGGAGNDNLQGGAGNDVYENVEAGDSITELAAAGSDTVLTSLASYTLGANVENLYFEESTGNHVGRGNALDNLLMGAEAVDTLFGDLGNDTLDGRGGADIMYGGAGNDIYRVDNFLDRVFENAPDGIDTVYSGVDYTLAANVENLVLTGDAELTGLGNAGNNIITGNSADNWLVGGDGNDVLDGRGGFDVMFGGKGNDTYYRDQSDGYNQDDALELANEGTDTLIASVDTRFLAPNIENLTLVGTALLGGGNAANNVITGNALDNQLMGGAGGIDTLIGGLGNDTYFVDTGDLVSELAAQGADTVIYAGSVSYSLVDTDGAGANGANVENLTLAAGAGNIGGTGNALDNVITGNAGANALDGGAGNDSLYGGTGDDVLLGGLGNDFLNGQDGSDTAKGGAGDDTYQISSSGDVVDESTAAAGAGIDTVISYLRVTDLTDAGVFRKAGGATGADVIENITLQASAVNATGNALANVIRGNAGVNTLTGGLGNDTYFVDLRDAVVETGASATEIDTVNLDVGAASGTIDMATRYTNVEHLTLTGSGNYNITGTAAANILTGNSGNNVLYGGAGIDNMRGGAGNDTYQVNVAGDVVTELAAQGMDTVESQITYILGAELENLTLTGVGAINGTGNALANVISGGLGNNTLTGLDGNDQLFGRSGNDAMLGGNGNDWLDGGSGNDTMTGGLGDDTYTVQAALDVIVEAAAQGNDAVIVNSAGFTFTLGAAVSIETLIANSGAGNVNITGNASDNTLIGNEGNNILTGGGGNDTFDGSAGGTDTFIGGAGNDTFNFNAAPDTFANPTIVGAGGTNDVVNAVLGESGLLGTPEIINATGIEVFNLTAAASGPDGTFIDLTPVVGSAGIAAINVTTAVDSGAHLDLYDLTGAGTAGNPAVTLNDYYGGVDSYFSLRLTNASGPADEVKINVNGVDTAINTYDVETVTLNVLGAGSQLTNEVWSAFNGATDINLTGGNGTGIFLDNLDQTLLGAGTQEIGVFDFAGGVELGLADGSGIADEIHVNVGNFNGFLEANGVETLVVDSGTGNAISRIEVFGDSIATLELEGDSSLIIPTIIADVVDASTFTGDYLRVRSAAAGGTDFILGQTGVGAILDGSTTAGDTFTFGGALDSTDRIDGRGGSDTVTAAIDGLVAGATGAPVLVSVETINFSNAASALNAIDRGASIDAANINTGTGYTLYLTGSGTNDAFIDTELLNFKGNLTATGYSGDLRVNTGGNGVARTYSVGTGNNQINGSSSDGIRDTFNFNSGIDALDSVQGYDIDNASGGDVLNATVNGLTANLGAHTGSGVLSIRGVETINLTTTGAASTIDASKIDHAYTLNILGTQDLTIANFDATGTVFNAQGMSSGAVNITGGAGNDNFTGGGGADTFTGGAGNDVIHVLGVGADSLSGGLGNDTFVYHTGGPGGTIDGGDAVSTDWVAAGRDTLDLTYGGAGLSVTLTQLSSLQGGVDGSLVDGGNTFTLRNIDFVIGTYGDDVLTGSFNAPLARLNGETAETFRGGDGNDTISGGGSGSQSSIVNWGHTDRADYQDSPGSVSVWLGARSGEATTTTDMFGRTITATSTTGSALDGFGGTDTLTYIDQVRGSANADWLVGGSDSREFSGSRGETFIGGAGNDYIAGGLTFSGSDNDRVDYSFDPGGVIVNLATGIARDGYGDTDTLFDINRVRGSDFSDILFGGNTLNDGNEQFEGGGGDDQIDGRSGLDTASYQNADIAPGAAGVTVNLVTGTATGFSVGTDTLVDVEAVFGSNGNDVLTGGTSTYLLNGVSWEAFRGNAGADSMDGGLGVDRVDYFADADWTTTANHAADGFGVAVNLGGSTTLGPDITQAEFATIASGSAWATDIAYSAGLLANRAFDGWGFTDTTLNMEQIRGSHFSDVLIGNALDNAITGGAGNDYIDGGAGIDTADYGSAIGGMTINLQTGTTSGGANGDGIDILIGIENVTGSGNNDNITGNTGNNVLNGGNGNDTLTGDAGNDFFVFNATPGATNVDTITDFTTGADKLQLDDSVFTAIGALGAFGASDARYFAGAGATIGQDATDRIIFDTTTGNLYYDADGNGVGASVLFATLQGAPVLAVTDIVII